MFAFFLLAVAAASDGAPIPVTRAQGAFFALSVPDADAAATWYSDKLGLTVIMRPPEQSGTQVIVVGGGGLIIELIEQQGAIPLSQAAPAVKHDTMVLGPFKAGAIVKDWDGLVAALKMRGVPIAMGPFPRTAEQRANLIIRDNNGNYIQFVESRPADLEAKAK